MAMKNMAHLCREALVKAKYCPQLMVIPSCIHGQ